MKTIGLDILILLTFSILMSCGGAKLTEIENCIEKVSIRSTDEVVFYFIEVVNRYEGYSYLKNHDSDDNYLCFHDRTGSFMDQCDSYEHVGAKATLLPSGTEITLDGFAVKSVKWGFDTIDTGPAPKTWFRGKVNDRVIWVSASQLQWMYEDNEDFKTENINAFNKLKLEERIPDPIVRDSAGNHTIESWKKYLEQKKRIHEWDCSL